MRICWCLHDGDHRGGADRAFISAARALTERGHEINVIVPTRASAEFLSELTSLPVSITTLTFSWWMQPRERWSYVRCLRHLIRNVLATTKLLKIIRETSPDIIVTNTLAIPIGAWAALITKRPHAWYVHEYGQEDHDLKFDFPEYICFKIVNKISDVIIANSLSIKTFLVKHVGEYKVQVIYCAVDVRKGIYPTLQQTKRSNVFRAILVGRKVPGKGQEDAIRAVMQLRKRGVPVSLSLVGSTSYPEYGERLRRLVAEQQIEPFVEFIDHVPNPEGLVASSDVALMCSTREAFGLVTVEAMKLGTPVIGAAAGGTTELINDGVTGLLYRPGDFIHLAEQIERLYTSKDFRMKLSERAREWANEVFTAQSYGESLETVLSSVVRTP